MSRDLVKEYDLEGAAAFIRSVNAQKVALQFPDEYLADAPDVTALLRGLLSRACEDKLHTLSNDAGCHPSDASTCCKPGSGCGNRAAEQSNTGNPDKQQHITVAVLGDTTFAGCCVDEVAAAHMSADCVVHIGHACMSATSALHAYYVFPPEKIDTLHAANELKCVITDTPAGNRVFLTWEPGYLHAIPEILSHLGVALGAKASETPEFDSATTATIDDIADTTAALHAITTTDCGMEPVGQPAFTVAMKTVSPSLVVPSFRWAQRHSDAQNAQNIENKIAFMVSGLQFTEDVKEGDVIFDIGHRANRLRMLCMQFAGHQIYRLERRGEEREGEEGTGEERAEQIRPVVTRKLMAAAYMHVEAIRDANIIGIVAGTLGVARHTEIINKLAAAVKAAGKHAYILMVGKLSAVKLGNFPEIDCFVLISCPENSVLDSDAIRAHVKPVVTPEEALIALEAGPEWTGRSTFRFEEVLSKVSADLKTMQESQPIAHVDTLPTSEPIDGTIAFSLDELHSEGAADEELPTVGAVSAVTATGTAMILRSAGQSTAITVSKFVSPASEYSTSKRSWVGLQYEIGNKDEEATTRSTTIVEGLKGIASTYVSEPGKHA